MPGIRPQNFHLRQEAFQRLLIERAIVAGFFSGAIITQLYLLQRIHFDGFAVFFMFNFALHNQQVANHYSVARAFPDPREEHQLNLAEVVFDGGKAHILVGLGDERAHFLNYPTDHHTALVLRLVQGIGKVGELVTDAAHVGAQGVFGNIEAQKLFFPKQLLVGVHFACIVQNNALSCSTLTAKEVHLAHINRAEMAGRNADHLVDHP